MPPSTGTLGGGYDGTAGAGLATRSPASRDFLRRRLRDRGRFSSSGKTLCSSVMLGAGDETRDSGRKADRMVWVPRRRRGFIGGNGGVVPAGIPTVGTFDVQDTKVGSEISFLLMGRFCSMLWPDARGGGAWAPPTTEAGLADGDGGISFNGGVALAE